MVHYDTKYQAYKNKLSYETVVKCDGGYLVLSPDEYRLWKTTK